MSTGAKTYTVRLREKGQVTIPKPVRNRLSAREGDILTLLQVDDMLLLVPQELHVPAIQARFQEQMDEAGVSLAELLEGLAAEREAIHREQMGKSDEKSA